MIVVSLSSVPPKLRGFLTKYLWEISAGVYVGNVNARVREALWKRIISNTKDISKAIMVFPSDNEQGFDFYVEGLAWKSIDYEGLKLIMRPSERGEECDKKSDYSESHPSNHYVVLDLETTGLDFNRDKIIEIGAIRITNGIEIDRFERIIKTNIPAEIEHLTGIGQAQADKGVEIFDALEDFGEFLNGDTTIGYNIRMFDLKFLKKEAMRSGVAFPLKKVIDVLEIVRRSFPDQKSYRLRDIAKLNGIGIENEKHRAITDCIICNEIYKLCRY